MYLAGVVALRQIHLVHLGSAGAGFASALQAVQIKIATSTIGVFIWRPPIKASPTSGTHGQQF